MRKKVLLALITISGFISNSAAQQQPAKIGIVNLQGAIVGTKDGQKATQDLEKKFSPKQKEFEARQNEISQLQDQYNKGNSVLSEEKRSQLSRSIEGKKKTLERDTQDAEEDLKNEQQKLFQSIGARMVALVEKFAKDSGYAVVLDVGNPNTPIVYRAEGIDITQDVIALYDKNAAMPTSASGSPTSPKLRPYLDKHPD